jgi:hypothetical protein
MKLVEVACNEMFGLIEEEHTYSFITFIKNKLWNCLNNHDLNLCTQFYNQQFFNLETFSYEKAINKCSKKVQYNVDVKSTYH